MSMLYPTFEIPDETEDSGEEEVTYPTSFAFDFEAGDFVTQGGKVEPAEGYKAWLQWCVKAALIQRGAHLVYTDDYGTDLDEITEANGRAEVESAVEAAITEALLVDPRTGGVSDFVHSWAGDELGVSFTVEPTIGTPERIDVTITR
jgi:hypothetical protein